MNLFTYVFWQINKEEHLDLRNYSKRDKIRQDAEFNIKILKPVTWLLLATNFGLTIYLIVTAIAK